MPAERLDADDALGPESLRVTGWAWYRVDTMVVLVGTDTADPDRRPVPMDGTPPPYWRISELAHMVEVGDSDPWREHMARELLFAVAADLAADPGFR